MLSCKNVRKKTQENISFKAVLAAHLEHLRLKKICRKVDTRVVVPQ